MATATFEPLAAPRQLAPFENAPPLDFSRREAREEFAEALDRVRARFPIEAPLVIGGRRITTPEKLVLASPNDLSLRLGHSAAASAAQTDQAVTVALRAFVEWSATPAQARAAYLLRAAEVLRKRRVEFAALEVFEAGKPWREADADVIEAIDFLEYYAREMLRLAQPRILQPHVLGERNELNYAPLGVVGVIGPWNFPLAIPVGMLAAGIVAGNTVLWKPAEQTPLVTWRFMEILMEIGLPPGVVNFLPGRGEVTGQTMVATPEVAMIAFIGSREVGLHIIRECAQVRPGQRHVKRVVAEMGGKNALILDETADLDSAIPDILHSAFGFSGQKCSALSRLIVVEQAYAEAVARLRDAMASLKLAPAWDPACQIGPVIDAAARRKIEEYLDLGQREGRAIFVGEAGALARQGHFVPPAAFEVKSSRARLAQEEIFGPVLAVLRAATFEHAIEIANDTDYALTGGLHSRSPRNLALARQRLQCGNLYLNRPITGAIVGRQPFGGYRLSGIGSKAGGPDYLKQFLVARAVSENLMRHGFAPLEPAGADAELEF